MNKGLAIIFGVMGLAVLALVYFVYMAGKDITELRDRKVDEAYMLSAEDIGKRLEGKSIPLIATVDGAFTNTEIGQDLYLKVSSAYAYKQKLELSGILEIYPDMPFCTFDSLSEMEDYKVTVSWKCYGGFFYTESITNMRTVDEFPGIDIFIHIFGVKPK